MCVTRSNCCSAVVLTQAGAPIAPSGTVRALQIWLLRALLVCTVAAAMVDGDGGAGLARTQLHFDQPDCKTWPGLLRPRSFESSCIIMPSHTANAALARLPAQPHIQQVATVEQSRVCRPIALLTSECVHPTMHMAARACAAVPRALHFFSVISTVPSGFAGVACNINHACTFPSPRGCLGFSIEKEHRWNQSSAKQAREDLQRLLVSASGRASVDTSTAHTQFPGQTAHIVTVSVRAGL